jgi:hypothetical protein
MYQIGGAKSSGEIVKMLTIKDANIIGSYGDPKQKYPADIDIDDHVVNMDRKDVYKFFKDFVNKAQKDPDIWITDFKAGHWRADHPLRWTIDDINRGYIQIEHEKITFLEALHQKSTIKIDLVVDIDGKLTEVNSAYFFTFKDGFSTKSETKADPLKTLDKQFKDLLKERKVFKALKRLYSIAKLEDDKEAQNWLLQFFNSPIGQMWQTIAILENIALLLEQGYSHEKKIESNLNLVKDRLPPNYKKYIDDILEDKKYINEVIEILKCDLNNSVVEMINKK